MTIEADFAELMVDTLVLERPPATTNLYGKGTFLSPETLQCRIVHTTKQMRSPAGEEVVSRSQAWIFGAPGITTTCRITLSDGTQPPILSVDSFPDDDGAHHEKVYFGGE